MKQTAVEWLVNVVQSCIAPDYIPKEIIQQAKAMEKEQIMDALQEFLDITLPDEVCEKYYNETFKSDNGCACYGSNSIHKCNCK